MTIKELHERLKGLGVNVTLAAVDDFLSSRNIKIEDVTDSVVGQIAADFKDQAASGLVVAKAGKAAKSPKRSTRKERAQSIAQEFQGAIATATKSTAVELETMADVVRQGAASYTEGAAQSIVDDLREIPLNVVRRVGELASQEVADPDTFRSAITSVLPFDWFNAPTDAT